MQGNEAEQVIRLLHPKLKEYLLSQGIQIDESGFFSCIHPDHPDVHPSASIGGTGLEVPETVFHCFSRGHSGNIFTAAHFLEHKPISGPEFYEDTLKYLADKFSIPYEPAEISDDVKRECQMRRAHTDAMNLVRYNIYKDGKLRVEHPAVKHLLERGISEEAIRKFKIGCIDSFEEYIKEMESLGWTDREFLNQAGLANKTLFNKNGIIVPIMDERDRVIGFVTRRTDMTANEHGTSKYINSPNTNIYKKGEVLFGFNHFLQDAVKQEGFKGHLFIVEGYLDCVMMYQAGIKNVAAIGATVLTDAHIDLLQRNGIKKLVLCLDADDGGRKGVKLAVERLSKFKYFNFRIMELPEGQDPDTYIRENGTDKFIELSKPEIAMSPFGWTLKYITFEDDPLTIAQNAIPTIANEESSVERLKMIRDLSRITAISETEIKKDVDSLVDKESTVFMEELKDLNTSIQMQLNRRKIKDTKTIVTDALSKINCLEQRYMTKVDNKYEFKQKINTLRGKIESGEFKYGLISPKFSKFEQCFDGVPYTCCLTLIGGRPSVGKTAFLTALEIDIIESNPDCAILDMSIDDNTDLRSLKILAVLSGLSTTQIKAYNTLTPENKKLVDQAWERYDMITDRFIIADATLGNTIDALEGHIHWLCEHYKDKKKIIVLDNFHKLRLAGGGGNKKTEATADQSQRIKDLVQLNDIHLMMTVELRKLENTDAKPHIQDLKDTVQLEYDADIVMLVHNEYQAKQGNTCIYHQVSIDGETRTMPFIEVEVHKNKINGRSDLFCYKLNTHNLRMQESNYASLKALYDKKTKGQTVKSGGTNH